MTIKTSTSFFIFLNPLVPSQMFSQLDDLVWLAIRSQNSCIRDPEMSGNETLLPLEL